MRILFLVHQFMPEFAAGTEQVTLNLAKAAQRDGHHVEVLTRSVREAVHWTDDSGELRYTSVHGIPVYGLRKSDLGPMDELGFDQPTVAGPDITRHAVERFLDSRKPYDIVHVLHSMRMLVAMDVIRERNLPYVITLTDFYLACWRTNLTRSDGSICSGPSGGANCIRHCSTLQLSNRHVLSRLERMADIVNKAAIVAACSPYVARVYESEFPDRQIHVIPHGVDLLRFTGASSPRSDREIVFGYVGTLSEIKGVHVLVEAFAKASTTNARLRLIGPAFDEEFAGRLRVLAERSGAISIEPAVRAEEIPHVLGTLSILCLPSIVPETYSLALHEAFAAGLPCAVSNLGYPADVIRENRSGDVVAPNNVEAWADFIRKLSEQPSLLNDWRSRVPLPTRVEEESFFYSQLYKGVGGGVASYSI